MAEEYRNDLHINNEGSAARADHSARAQSGYTDHAARAQAASSELSDEEISRRIGERKKLREKRRRRKRGITLAVFIIAFALMATMCGKDIVRLKAENRALKRQKIALEKQRDELKEELSNTGKQEYIREQARKQLRLLNPGEILFTFDDDGSAAGSGADEDAESGADEADGDKDASDGGSDG